MARDLPQERGTRMGNGGLVLRSNSWPYFSGLLNGICRLLFRALALQVFLGLVPLPSTQFGCLWAGEEVSGAGIDGLIALPAPDTIGKIPLETSLAKRKTRREFSGKSLALGQIGQMLWAGQGITHDQVFRTAPSAGGLYPIEIRVIVGNVDDLPSGVYRYRPVTHDLERTSGTDLRTDLGKMTFEQDFVARGAALFVVSGVVSRTGGKYGSRGSRYVFLEAGHVAQNMLLQAAALDLAVGLVGAFGDEKVRKALKMVDEEIPLYFIPVGHRLPEKVGNGSRPEE